MRAKLFTTSATGWTLRGAHTVTSQSRAITPLCPLYTAKLAPRPPCEADFWVTELSIDHIFTYRIGRIDHAKRVL